MIIYNTLRAHLLAHMHRRYFSFLQITYTCKREIATPSLVATNSIRVLERNLIQVHTSRGNA